MKTKSTVVALMMAIFCFGLLVVAFYLEFVSNLIPCALCLAQRIVFAIIGISCLLYLLPFYSSRLIFALTSTFSGTLGIWLASRQLWLQSLPSEQIPPCGPDIYFIFRQFPITESFQTMILGTGNCAEVQWTFLNLSIPSWTLVAFVLLTLGSLWISAFRGPRPFRLFKS